MSATTACLRGCTIRGEHLTDCAGDPCTGCLPRRATDGLLCTACHCSVQRDLTAAPHLVEHLRTLVIPGQGSDDAHVDGTREAPLPISAAAVDAADDLHAMLASWVMVVLEEHPSRLTGPDLAGSRTTEATMRRVHADPWAITCADCGRWTASDRKRAITGAGTHVDATDHVVTVEMLPDEQRWSEATYIAPQVAGLGRGQDRTPTSRLTHWLARHLSWIEEQEWCAEMVREITSTVATLLARYPEAERARPIPDLPCPRCERLTLVYYPPPEKRYRDDPTEIVVQCAHHSCSVKIPESEWGLTIRRYLDEVGEHKPEVHEPKPIGHSVAGYGGRA